MARIHLVTADEPQQYGQASAATANCGKLLEMPVLVFCWDEQPMHKDLELSTLGICKKCVGQAFAGRYIYGLRESRVGG